MTEKTLFNPDWASAPGNTITDILEERNLSIMEFAQQMGHNHEQVNQLIQGYVPITKQTAQLLENILGPSAAFWLSRDLLYRERIARFKKESHPLSDKKYEDWLKDLPVNEMIKWGWINSVSNFTEKVTACLNFFGVSSLEAWHNSYNDILENTVFRTSKSFNSNPIAVTTWLRKGEIESQFINCEPWNPKKFRETLPTIRALTRNKNLKNFILKLKQLCANCGVAVVIVRAPSSCRASGATWFVSQNKALLLLSFRHLSDDQFWFTFFHEAGHLLLHSRKTLILDEEEIVKSKEEEEANNFASEILIPSKYKEALLKLRPNKLDVMKFAVQIGVSKGIVVGQLQNLGQIGRERLTSLKNFYNWDEISSL